MQVYLSMKFFFMEMHLKCGQKMAAFLYMGQSAN